MKNRIKELCKEKQISFIELARKTDIARQTLTAYSTGARQPSLHNLDKIAEVLSCDPIELLEPSKPGYGHFYLNGVWEGIRK